jgi:hypothetical protein
MTLKIFAWLNVVAISVLFIGFFVVLPSGSTWFQSRNISDALADSRSVTIVEFTHIFDVTSDTPPREVVLQSVPATSDQISRFRSATDRLSVLRLATRSLSLLDATSPRRDHPPRWLIFSGRGLFRMHQHEIHAGTHFQDSFALAPAIARSFHFHWHAATHQHGV